MTTQPASAYIKSEDNTYELSLPNSYLRTLTKLNFTFGAANVYNVNYLYGDIQFGYASVSFVASKANFPPLDSTIMLKIIQFFPEIDLPLIARSLLLNPEH